MWCDGIGWHVWWSYLTNNYSYFLTNYCSTPHLTVPYVPTHLDVARSALNQLLKCFWKTSWTASCSYTGAGYPTGPHWTRVTPTHRTHTLTPTQALPSKYSWFRFIWFIFIYFHFFFSLMPHPIPLFSFSPFLPCPPNPNTNTRTHTQSCTFSARNVRRRRTPYIPLPSTWTPRYPSYHCCDSCLYLFFWCIVWIKTNFLIDLTVFNVMMLIMMHISMCLQWHAPTHTIPIS